MSNTRRRAIGAAVVSVLAVLAVGLSGPAQAAEPVTAPAATGAQPVVLPPGADPETYVTAAGETGALAARLGPFHLWNVNSGRCIAIQNASTAQNAFALQFTCDNTEPHNDDWYFDEVTAGGIYYHLVNRHSGKCLAVQNAGTADNARILQFTCDNTAPHNDDWYLTSPFVNSSEVHIVNRHSGRCLTVQNASLNNNAPILQFGCESNAPYNESWLLL
ncbi:RICIN domain-containing protein [Actinoplanes couchii]|uniref:Ricin B lectin domain-containing protein n=1 Tax=Actinoplanes couchii TaxID=403638 RepID=A0ABQ3XNH0_9ACTN|nr:RICIN domain-containing protein [Actinoplanes couchii]MDR6318065.1 hypothetical protein [Actinoplanes couchii]GID60018.1 hypothetical protein Aco03nite_084220 [Actinoplanes couchii]